ncbi:amidohydrolase [uncultured Pseudoteredinibacter sp.]|uniref:amidohydrolase n=1 Tax=uncultured Pseudoteredinibacter sp. TaxID=1641701 RepID=UPI00262E140D|nr:amidohydrolase [uncultured Pseudoteredinibacter sp.]
MSPYPKTISTLIAALSAGLIAHSAQSDTIYHGGPILSMVDDAPFLDAVLVRGDKIEQTGRLAELEVNCQTPCQKIDLQGRSLLPGFIDAHGHYTMTLDFLAYKNVASPPVGPVKNIAALIKQMQQQSQSSSKGGGEHWILGAGYDDSLLAEKRHPTRQDLDKVSTTQPVFIRHVSGHLGVCNSRCLELAGITADSKNPEGGVFRREAGSQQPNGVLEETALDAIHSVFPEQGLEEQLARIPELDKYYAQYGITTVQDGATSNTGLALLQQASQKQLLSLDVISYPYTAWADFSKYTPSAGAKQPYQNHFRNAGVKLVLDGSPQGKTAWLSAPYHHPPHGQGEDYQGYPILTDAQLEKQLTEFFNKGWQVLAHCNGDAAAEQLIQVMSKLKKKGVHLDRTVMIHAQTVRDDQLSRMKELGIIPSFFVAHTYFWGDWHRDSVLGLDRAKRISPLISAKRQDIKYTIHNDTPIVPPNMPLLLWTAANRETRSGKTLGQDQRANIKDALKAITINAAYQHYEEDSKGSIEAGKLADLVILDRNPLMIPPQQLKDIEVLETIKGGKTVYKRSPNTQ